MFVMNIRLAEMIESDIDEVLEIERASFPSPWSKMMFLNELSNPNSRIILAKGESDEILGFICFWNVAGEIHILNLAAHPGHRRQGIGKRLLTHVIESSIADGAGLFALEVRSRNRTAISFYKSFGFKEVGIRKGYYADTGDDAVLMDLELNIEKTAQH